MPGYVRCICCNQPITVTDDDIGSMVKCPRTGRMVSVRASDVRPEESAGNPPAPVLSNRPQRPQKPPRNPPVPTTPPPLANENPIRPAPPPVRPTPPHVVTPTPTSLTSPEPGRKNRSLLIVGGVLGLLLLSVLCVFAAKGIRETLHDDQGRDSANQSQPNPNEPAPGRTDPPQPAPPSDPAGGTPPSAGVAPTLIPKKTPSPNPDMPVLPKVPDPKPPISPSPAEKLADLIKDNEMLPGKTIPGKAFTYQIPKVKGAQCQFLNPVVPIGMTLTPEGLLTWTPRLGQRATTYAVKLNIKNVGDPPAAHSIPERNFTRTIKIALEENPENALALPAFGGWVMLSDGATLIVTLPVQKKLVYIDTITNKELKRVDVMFTPNLLAVQGKRLFVSALSDPKSEVHVLDRDTGVDKKTIIVPGKWLTEMVCHREKGLVYATDGTTLMAIDPDADNGGSAQPVATEPGTAGPAMPSAARAPRCIDLAMDQSNPNVLYAVVEVTTTSYEHHRWRDDTVTVTDNAYLIKFTVQGKHLLGSWVAVVSPPSEIDGHVLMGISSDGKRVGAFTGATCASGSPGMSLLPSNGILSQSEVASCGNNPGDIAFHPVLDMGVVEENSVPVGLAGAKQQNQTVFHIFNSKSLVETTFPLLADNPVPAGNPVKARLLTFSARGTKLLYYDSTQGYLRSIPLTLTDKDKEALARAYPEK